MLLKQFKGVLAFGVLLWACALAPGVEKKTVAASAAGPQILKDGAKFVYVAPQAKKVFIAGDF